MNQSLTIDDRTAMAPARPVPERWGWISAGLAVAFVVVGFSSMMRPSLGGLDAPLSEFSGSRALVHVDQIARAPHPMGSDEIEQVRQYLIAQLTDIGLAPVTQTFVAPDYFGAPGATVRGANVMARIEGDDPSGAILLVAHHDTVPSTPGGNDNSAGVAALIEAARVVLAGEPPARDVIVLLTDGEEPSPRFGAAAFVESHDWFADVELVVNLEAIGTSGPSLLVETAGSESALIDGYTDASGRPGAFSFLTETTRLFGGVGTDFDVFSDRGLPGLSFAYLRGSTVYHTERDTAETVSASSLQHHGENVLAVVRGLGEGDPSTLRQDDRQVFFGLTPTLDVAYAAAVGVGLSGALLVGAVSVLIVGARRDRIRPGAIGRGALVGSIGSLAAALVVFGSWWLLTAVRDTFGVWEGYVYLGILVGVAALVLSYVGGAVAGRYRDFELSSGVSALWAGLAVLTSIWLPGFGYLFLWPAVGAFVALSWTVFLGRSRWVWLIPGVPALVLSIPAIDAFFQMAQPRPGNPDSDLTVAITLVGLLTSLVIALIVPFWSTDGD